MNNNAYDNDDITSPLWKIKKGKNGDQYLTFSGSSATALDRNWPQNSTSQIKVYKIRWFILLVISLSNISNAFNWICFGSIADFTGDFYNISYKSVNFLSLLYLIVSVPSGFISFWLIDTFGIRASINLGAWINFLGSAVKMASSLDLADAQPLVSSSNKYSVLLIGQSLCALAQPFVLFVATKFANTWFADDQRSLANTIALASNTLGVLIGAFVSPQIVYSSQEFISEISLLNILSCFISVIPAILAAFINRSNPKLPPSFSAILNNPNTERREYVLNEAEEDENNFWSNFKHYLTQIAKLLSSKDFFILFMSFGLSLGLFNTLTTLLEQILCTRGYSDTDVGYFGGAMIISGMIGSLITGFVLDKTKRFEEISKICFCISALSNVLFVILQLYNNDNSLIYYLLLISFCLTGFFGLPLLPICMDMAIECVYPIPEAVSTGLLFIAGQIFGVVLILIYPGLAKDVAQNSFVYQNIQTCSKVNVTGEFKTESNLSVLDFSYPLYGQCVLQCCIAIFFTIFFKCSYLRLKSEQEKIAEQIFNSVRN